MEFNVCVHKRRLKSRRRPQIPICLLRVGEPCTVDLSARRFTKSRKSISPPYSSSFPLRRTSASDVIVRPAMMNGRGESAWFAGQRLIVPAACEAFLLSRVSWQMTRYTRGHVIEEGRIDRTRRERVSFARRWVFFVFATKSLLRTDVLLVPLSNRSAAWIVSTARFTENHGMDSYEEGGDLTFCSCSNNR